MGLSVQKLDDLETAIDHGDDALPKVLTLLNSGLSVNSQIRRRSALYLAIEKDRTHIAELLLARGANVKVGYFTERPLHIAAARGNVRIARQLLAKEAWVNVRNHMGCTPLWLAASEGQGNMVDLLLQQPGVDINCHTDDTFFHRSIPRTTVLCQATLKQHYDICTTLLMAGARMDLPDINSWTPLHYACRLGNAPLVSLFIQHGCSLDYTTKDGHVPLHIAITFDHPRVVDELVRTGFDINFPSSNNCDFIPLLSAVKRGNPDVVDALCSSSSIEIDRKDCYSMTALIVACQTGNADCLKEMLHSGSDVRSLDSFSLQPLSHAVCLEEDPHLRWRLQQQQQTKANGKECSDGEKDEFGVCGDTELDGTVHTIEKVDGLDADCDNTDCSLLDNIIRFSVQSVGRQRSVAHLEVLHVLITAGADLHVKDDFHKTAVEYAMNLYGFQSVLMLLCHGAKVDRELLKSFLATNYLKPTCVMQGFIFPLMVALMWSSVEHHRLFQWYYLTFPFHNSCDLPLSVRRTLGQPMSLARHCRSVVRDALVRNSSRSISRLVQRLPVPRAIQQFLLLSDVLQLLLVSSQGAQADQREDREDRG